MIEIEEVLGIIGVLLIALALWFTLGWAGIVGFMGIILLTAAWLIVERKRRDGKPLD